MKRYYFDLLIILAMVLTVVYFWFYTPPQARELDRQRAITDLVVSSEERLDLSQDLTRYFAWGLPKKDRGATPSLLHFFIGRQRKVLDLSLGRAQKEIREEEIGEGKIKVWSMLNMGTVVKTSQKTIGFDLADTYFSSVQKGLTDLIDVLLVTHGDRDHFDTELIKKALREGKTVVFPANFGFYFEEAEAGQIVEIESGESLDLDGVKITAYQTDHRGEGDFNKPNAWYLVETGGFKILHSGDGLQFKKVNEVVSLKSRNDIDIFLANNALSTENIAEIGPKIAVPLHLFKFMQNRESLDESGFKAVSDKYSLNQDQLVGIEMKFLFPGESFEYGNLDR